MDPDVPKEGFGDQPDELVEKAERAFEEHEADLIEEVIALAERGIPPKATVREAMIELHRAMREDPEPRELIERLVMMIVFGGGTVAKDWNTWRRANRPVDDSDPPED